MARINHVALKVTDLETATRFYETVFGFRQVGTGRSRGHISRHLTDGYVDLALMVYDSEEDEEAKLVGPGPAIHHFGIAVEDREAVPEPDRGGWWYDPVKARRRHRQVPLARRNHRRNRRPRPLRKAGRRTPQNIATDQISSIIAVRAPIPFRRKSRQVNRAIDRDRICGQARCCSVRQRSCPQRRSCHGQ